MMNDHDIVIISRKKHNSELNKQLGKLGNAPKIILSYKEFDGFFKVVKYPFKFKIIIVPELDWDDAPKKYEHSPLLGAVLVEEIRLHYACIAPIAFVSFLKAKQIEAHIPAYMDNDLEKGNFFRLPCEGLEKVVKDGFVRADNRERCAEEILGNIIKLENNSQNNHMKAMLWKLREIEKYFLCYNVESPIEKTKLFIRYLHNIRNCLFMIEGENHSLKMELGKLTGNLKKINEDTDFNSLGMLTLKISNFLKKSKYRI